MSDITMCVGEGCMLKKKCYRYLARRSEQWQSYFSEPPVVDGVCSEYWEVERDPDE
jgi:hypothetical protein